MPAENKTAIIAALPFFQGQRILAHKPADNGDGQENDKVNRDKQDA